MYKSEKTQLQKKQETQRVFDYCLYMMLTSYFKASKCRSKQLETKLFLGYKEYNVNKVYDLEASAIQFIEEQILSFFSEDALKQPVEVWMVPDKSADCTKMILHTSEGYYEVEGNYRGKSTQLQVSVLHG